MDRLCKYMAAGAHPLTTFISIRDNEHTCFDTGIVMVNFVFKNSICVSSYGRVTLSMAYMTL